MNNIGFLEKLKSKLLDNISNENFGVKELSTELGLSRSQLLRRVKSLTGKSANQLIKEIRLEESVNLLKTNKYTISEISFMVGFSSPSYFNKCFHKSYGLTPGNYQSKLQYEENDPQLVLQKPKPKYSKIYSTTLILLIFISLYSSFVKKDKEAIIESTDRILSIAVLPILDLSERENMQHLSIGLTDAITLELSKLNDLRVISRGSAMYFKDSSVIYSDIAEKLGVKLLLEGSILYSGDSLRITIQLIDTYPNEQHLWAEKYLLNSSNVLSIADNISKQIAEEINIVVKSKNNEIKVNPIAYEDYLKGKFLLEKQNPKSVQKAMDYFNSSIALDSTYAPSYYELAECYIIMNKFIRNNKKKLENREKSRELINKALDKAIELDDNLSEAYITKGNILAKFDWDWEGMKNMAEKGLKINPNNAKGHILLAKYYLINSMFDKAIEEAAYAAKLDPLNPNICSQYANVLVLSKNYNLAENVYLDVLELFPNFGFAWDGIGRCYYLMDRKEDAIISWSKLHDIMGNYDMAEYFRNENPQKSLDHWLSEATVTNKLYCSNPSIISMAHLFANDKSGSIEYLKYSYEVKNEDLPLIMMNPIFASISETDTYKEIGLKVGLQNN